MDAFSLLDGVSGDLSPGAPGQATPDVRDLYRSAPPMTGERIADGLPVGQAAPDFALPDAEGELVRLSDFRGMPVAVVFYPLDWSPGCSVQLELYQQEFDEFASRGVQLLGISVDSLYSHGAWAAVRGIRYPLLSDFNPRGDVARRYRVWRDADGFSERALYVIDRDGVIRWAHVSPELHHLPDLDDLIAALELVRADPEVTTGATDASANDGR